ncbi:hypothetical protein [Paludisphaera rhizosphaerae]|uniref:hypothetical protein n=1 Tax=Paludisphaera rhizosphaerae TaxID=2711216 RepID=UPI0013EC254B|nr:hypothetical protein [Paludisphaera rhizosphaerae]
MSLSRRLILVVFVLFLPPSVWAEAPRVSRIDNGVVRVGVDLDLGGVITELGRSDPKTPNLINSHDYGRQIQQSYYSGPQPFGKAHPGWKNWPWNPIGTGDAYKNPARVVEHTNDGKVLYVKSIPMQWALNNVPGDCTFETWIAFDPASPASLLVRCRLNNAREDHTQYPARDQELPAVYTVGTLHRLITYKGTNPFAGEPVATIANAGPPWASWTTPEHWAALVGDDGWGVGVIHPGLYHFIGGFHDKPGVGGPKDNPTGYIAPVRQEILDHDIAYEYSYVLTLGTVDEIRERAKALRPADSRPNFRFNVDRRHWTYHDLADAGLPPKKGLLLSATGSDAYALAPEQWYPAADVPRLHLTAANLTTAPIRGFLFWRGPGESFHDDRKVPFEIPPTPNPDAPEPVVVDLAAHSGYKGTVAALRIDLDPAPTIPKATPFLRLDALSWRSSTRAD